MATGVRTDTGRVRDGNEDRYLVREEQGLTLLAVADGVGGSSGGEIAADAALAELGTRFFEAAAGRATSDALAEAMRDANAAVLRAAGASGHRDAATTIVAAAVRADEAIIGNLGDSRAYLIRDRVCRQLTEDHSGEMEHAITRFAGRSARHPARHLRREPSPAGSAAALQRRADASRHARGDRRMPRAVKTCVSPRARSWTSRTREAVRTTSRSCCMRRAPRVPRRSRGRRVAQWRSSSSRCSSSSPSAARSRCSSR